MAKKKPEKKVTTTTEQPAAVRHARIELEDADYERLRRVAKLNGLSVAAYIRQAVLRQVRRDEAEGGDQ